MISRVVYRRGGGGVDDLMMELQRCNLLRITEENLKPLIAIHELNYLRQIERLTVEIMKQ